MVPFMSGDRSKCHAPRATMFFEFIKNLSPSMAVTIFIMLKYTCTSLQVDKSDQAKAVEMKMYGKLTREVIEWHPDKLLCRRFNIANPYPESSQVGSHEVRRDKVTVFNFLNVPKAKEQKQHSPPRAIQFKGMSSSFRYGTVTPEIFQPCLFAAFPSPKFYFP
jgi:hypothetical protein